MKPVGVGWCSQLLILIWMLIGFCGLAASAPPPSSSEAFVATFTAEDYGFDGPAVLPSGMTAVRLANHGREPHHIQLLRLEEGKGPQDLNAAFRESVLTLPSWAKRVGGPNGVEPGEEGEAVVYLAPGSYVLICTIPAHDGMPHVALGMRKSLQVIERAVSKPAFSGHYHLAMRDFEFSLVERIRPGRHTFYTVNRGGQPHEVSLFRLAADASPDQIVSAWTLGHGVPSPGKLVGGITELESGAEGVFTATLSPGRYALICLFPNPHTPDSHARKGMVLAFTVQ